MSRKRWPSMLPELGSGVVPRPDVKEFKNNDPNSFKRATDHALSHSHHENSIGCLQRMVSCALETIYPLENQTGHGKSTIFRYVFQKNLHWNRDFPASHVKQDTTGGDPLLESHKKETPPRPKLVSEKSHCSGRWIPWPMDVLETRNHRWIAKSHGLMICWATYPNIY